MTSPFAPVPGATVSITVGAASANVALGELDQFRVMNNGSATVWVKLGNSGVTAALADSMPIGPGTYQDFTVPPSLEGTTVYAAAIAAAATGIVYFTPGEGT